MENNTVCGSCGEEIKIGDLFVLKWKSSLGGGSDHLLFCRKCLKKIPEEIWWREEKDKEVSVFFAKSKEIEGRCEKVSGPEDLALKKNRLFTLSRAEVEQYLGKKLD